MAGRRADQRNLQDSLGENRPALYRNAAIQASPASPEFDKTQCNQYHAFYVAVQHR
jgi:hypothetical protein